MGDLLCSCEQATLVNCCECEFGRTRGPVKMFKSPWPCLYRPKPKDYPKDQIGLDLLAGEILNGLSTEQLNSIGYVDDDPNT